VPEDPRVGVAHHLERHGVRNPGRQEQRPPRRGDSIGPVLGWTSWEAVAPPL
jgi:hypothetical protein